MLNHIYFKNKVYIKGNGKIIPARVAARFIRNNYPELYNELLFFSKENNIITDPFSKLIWHYINGSNIPRCKNCCNNTNWINFSSGYGEYCSTKCVSTSLDIKKKKEETCIKKFGTKYASQSKEVKEKTIKTNLEKYGAEYTLQVKEIRDEIDKTNLEKYGNKCSLHNDIIKEKTIETNLKKYGKKHHLSSQIIIDKRYKTNLDKYGNKIASKNEKVVNNAKETCLDKYGVDNYKKSLIFKNVEKEKKIDKLTNLGILKENIINIENSNITIKCDVCRTSNTYTNYFIHQRLVLLDTTLCIKCNPLKGISSKENKIYEFISSFYKKDIKRSDRVILNNRELDVYLPDLNLAFEFNGIYWHSELYKDNNYHLEKTKKCLEQGIQLIHIYEDDWIYKKEIIKSNILYLLGRSERIYAMKCKVREVSSKNASLFLEENHIQGYANSKIRLGLYYKDSQSKSDKLVSLMTFGRLRKKLGQKSKEYSFELLRFCNKLNTTIIGGADKLFKHFLNNYQPKEVISYADRSWSNGELYEKLGFELIDVTKPNYYYVINDLRENKIRYRKDILIKEGFDASLTEHEIMLNREIYRIYDSGSLKYKYINEILLRQED